MQTTTFLAHLARVDDDWNDWRRGVLAVIRDELGDLLGCVNENDVDWDAWRALYDEGRSPRAAVDRAFLKDL